MWNEGTILESDRNKWRSGRKASVMSSMPQTRFEPANSQIQNFIYLSNWRTWCTKFLFYSKFISCFYMFRAPCAHHQEVKIALHSLWYHHTETSEWSKITKIQFYKYEHIVVKFISYIKFTTMCEINFTTVPTAVLRRKGSPVPLNRSCVVCRANVCCGKRKNLVPSPKNNSNSLRSALKDSYSDVCV